MSRIVDRLARHGGALTMLMGWFFLVVGGAIVLMIVGGLVYALTHRMWPEAAEFAIGTAIFAGMPWLGLKMVREGRKSN